MKKRARGRVLHGSGGRAPDGGVPAYFETTLTISRHLFE
jgi:hypothetical protein